MIACHAAASRDLTLTQAEGHACIRCRCGTPGAGELIPVGVIVPPLCGDGIARACQLCAAVVLAPWPDSRLV